MENGLAAIPEVIEVHATTGDADLMAKVVARGIADLYLMPPRYDGLISRLSKQQSRD